MKIYYIYIKEWTYDCMDSHVIVAHNEEEVRNFAINKACDEGSKVWITADIVKQGDYTGDREIPFVLLSSFNAG